LLPTVSQEQALKTARSGMSLNTAKLPLVEKSKMEPSIGTTKSRKSYDASVELGGPATSLTEDCVIEPTLQDFIEHGHLIIARVLVHTEFLPKKDFPLLHQLLRKFSHDRRALLFLSLKTDEVIEEVKKAKALINPMLDTDAVGINLQI
jgi:hypothetical protein